MTVNRASARYEGFGKEGKGSITTKSGVLDKQPYGFGTRFEGQPGTNPEELIAAAHAACFTMALSFGLARAGYSGDTLETRLHDHQIGADLDRQGAGDRCRRVRQDRRRGREELPGVEAARLRDHPRA
jgi:OsmC subfamily peroxiredoxin